MNLQTLKLFISGLISFLLVGGYVGSQYFYWAGISPAWMSVVDVPSIKFLSLFLFLGSVVYFYMIGSKAITQELTEGETA